METEEGKKQVAQEEVHVVENTHGEYVYYGCLDRLGWSVGKGKLRMIRGKIGVQVAF